MMPPKTSLEKQHLGPLLCLHRRIETGSPKPGAFAYQSRFVTAVRNASGI
jgi:hypothetical protein